MWLGIISRWSFHSSPLIKLLNIVKRPRPGGVAADVEEPQRRDHPTDADKLYLAIAHLLLAKKKPDMVWARQGLNYIASAG